MGVSPEGEHKVEEYVESPRWMFSSEEIGDAGHPTISATFIFSARLGQAPNLVDPSDHFRLNVLSNKLRGEDAWEALIEPTQSYFDDIVRVGLGRVGRPLVFLCEPPCDLDARTIVMHRPASTNYHAESRNVILHRPASKPGDIKWAMRDAFALFESGHLLYLLSLSSIEDQLDRIDEYALIQLQKLLSPHYEATNLRSDIKFSFDSSGPHDLIVSIQNRLNRLAESESKSPNGIRHILNQHVLERHEKLPGFEWTDLRSMIFAIESDRIWKSFTTADDELESDSQDSKEWQDEQPSAPGELLPHLSPKCLRPQLYVLSGFLHGVLDFPWQDSAELADALEPLSVREDSVVFCTRQCLIEIGTSEWRSLRKARTSLGTCPYLTLVQCMALYHEILISELERKIDVLLYQEDPDDARGQVRAKAMKDLAKMLKYASDVLRLPSNREVERKLRERIAIVRDFLIFRPINIFGYRTERDLFEDLATYNKVEPRTEAIKDLLDRYGSLIEDSHQVLTLTAEQRFSLVLFTLAILGAVVSVLTIYDPLEALFGRDDYHFLKNYHLDLDRLAFVIAGFVVLLCSLGLLALWSRRR